MSSPSNSPPTTSPSSSPPRCGHRHVGTELDAEAIQVDLATEEGVEELYRRVGGQPVDALALNAGIGARRAFATDTELRQELQLVDHDDQGAPGVL